MDLQLLFLFQSLADVILCIAIFFILFLITRENKKRPVRNINPEIIAEFQRTIDTSHNSINHLIKAMDESRKALKEIAYALDERENRLRSLIAQAENIVQKSQIAIESEIRPDGYERVLAMIREGLEAEEIAGITGLTRGEVELMINLDRKKNEIL
jgi:hypothetical protein